jgi:hypothetical protein
VFIYKGLFIKITAIGLMFKSAVNPQVLFWHFVDVMFNALIHFSGIGQIISRWKVA